jgi:hypothetical protein
VIPSRIIGCLFEPPGIVAFDRTTLARVLDKGADPLAEINPRVAPKSADLGRANRHPTYRFHGEFQSAEFWHTTPCAP